jgi:hypothetical protein
LTGLPEQIHCDQCPWYQVKCWACSWLCSSPVLPFFGLGEFGLHSSNIRVFKHLCTSHAFFP